MSTNINILYYITTGKFHKRNYDGKPFFINYPWNSSKRKFNLKIIKSILSKDNIDISIIDDYRYFDKKKKGFIKIREKFKYPLESDELILQIHLGKPKNKNLLEIQSKYDILNNKIREIEEKININKNCKENIDLYFLYASPLLNSKGEEEFKPINYRPEIRHLINIFEKSKQEFNCIFECANEKKFREAIIKQPKILHISSHGLVDENRKYSLMLEEKAVAQKIHQDRLRQILSTLSNQLQNIDLIFASTCYSETLGKLFLDFGIKNVIYIQGMTPVSDKAAINFSKNFYSEIINGTPIGDAYDKSKKLVQSDKEKEYFNIEKCCCSHWHRKECPLKKNKKLIHYNYHIKCDCNFEEYNIHEEDCDLIKKIKNDKVENYFYFENYINNTIKICCICCKPGDNSDEKIPPHGESFKFILKQKNPSGNNIIFRYKREGKLNKNKNCYIMNDKDKFKNFAIVGRRKQVKEIYEIIDNANINNIHFIIIHGAFEVGKRDFAESVCIYLFERKIINDYWMIDIRESKELVKKVKELTDNGKNSDGKYILVIKINYNLEDPIYILNDILKDKNILNPYFYYFILLVTKDEEIGHLIEFQENKYKIIYLENLNKILAKKLLFDLCSAYGYSSNFKILNEKDNQIDDLLEMVGYSRKNINILVEIIGKYNDFEKIKDIIQTEDFNDNSDIKNEIRKLMEKDISKIYFVLSFMPYGLPSSIFKLYSPDFQKIINEEDEEKLISINPNNNWYTIIEKRYKREIFDLMPESKRKECICKCLEIYAKLLFYFIKKTREKICFPDSNVHYHFNSYNNKGIWKTFDLNNYELCFIKDDKSNDYNNIIDNDFLLEKHTENIYNLIDVNAETIKTLIFSENRLDQKEYLYQILLMLPSVHILGKHSNLETIINNCINLSEKFNLTDSKQRLNLFLLSKKENPNINLEDFKLLGDQGKADAYFINGLKQNNKESFFKAIDKYQKLNNKELNILIPYAYYEIGWLYFLEKEYQSAIKYLMIGEDFSNFDNDNFIKDKICLALALVMEEENYKNKEKIEKYLKKAGNESTNIYLISEASNKLKKFREKTQPDIVMLNSNPLIYKENSSNLNNSIAYHNNQYYILQKIFKNIKRGIRVKSIVLNQNKLKESLNDRGKYLILQADDFNKEGEIVLELNNGEGEILLKDKLKDIIPKKLNYELVILCFIKSEKLKDLFAGKVKYLITFNDININDIEFDMLFKYNELSIDFLINFIINSTKSNIKTAFEESLQSFIAGLDNQKTKIELINKNDDYITLTKYKEDLSQSIILKKKDENIENEKEVEGQVIFEYPLLKLPIADLHIKTYTDDIIKIIILILSGKQIINIYSNDDLKLKNEKYNIKEIISFEIMKFLYRHQKFNGNIFYIDNPKKYGSTLKAITNDILGENKIKNFPNENTTNVENINTGFIVINKFDKINKIQGFDKDIIFEEVPDNFQYLIISKLPIDKKYSYEIKINNEENFGKKNKKSKKNKKKDNKKKIDPNSIQNKYSGASMPFIGHNNIAEALRKRDTEIKKNENKIKLNSYYDIESDFFIVNHESSDSNDQENSLSESEDSN